jgi:hypothetical protein
VIFNKRVKGGRSMSLKHYEDYDDSEMKTQGTVFNEFDCPECDANNPYDDGFCGGDEVRCFYCGEVYKVMINGNGKPKFKPA